MSSTAINEAIVNHRAWVMRLKTYLGGVNTERFEPAEVTNPQRCEFGQWLATCPSCFKSEDSRRAIEQLHDNFHQVAGDIAILIQEFDQPSDVEPYLQELEALSKALVRQLMLERE